MFKSAYLSGTAEYSCAVPVKMKFNKDEMYEVSYQHTGLTCTAEVSRIHKTSEGKIRREAVKVFNNYTYGFGEKCKEAFEKSTNDSMLSELANDLGSPQVMVADTNWGDELTHTFFVAMPDPTTGELRLWKKREPGGELTPEDRKWVDTLWDKTG